MPGWWRWPGMRSSNATARRRSSRRFAQGHQRPMTAHDWSGLDGGQGAGRHPLSQRRRGPRRSPGQSAGRRRALDGSKGARLTFRPWDGQLRQPLLLTDGQGVIAQAPSTACCTRATCSTPWAPTPRRSCARRAMTLRRPPPRKRSARRGPPCAAGAARHRRARAAEVLAADRPPGVGAGAPAAVAGGVCRGLPQRLRHRHRRALRHLHPLRRLHRAGPGRHGAAVQRHAVVAGHGLRPRDGPDAAAADRAAAACLAAVLQAVRDRAAVGAAGAGLRDRRDAARHRPAGARPRRPHALLALAAAR